jgi:hypothetical protein
MHSHVLGSNLPRRASLPVAVQLHHLIKCHFRNKFASSCSGPRTTDVSHARDVGLSACVWSWPRVWDTTLIMAAAPDNGGDLNTSTWRILLFFVLILFIDTAWELLDERVTHGIRKRQKKGLLHAWEQIKFEVMALGLVSLLLVVFEVRARACGSNAQQPGPCTRFSIVSDILHLPSVMSSVRS